MAAVTVLTALLVGCSTTSDSDLDREVASGTTPGSTPPEESPSPPMAAPSASAPAATPSPAVETIPIRVERRTTDASTAGFVTEAVAILTDPRGWQRAGFRFVADDEAPYLLVLAEGDEVDRLCEPYDTGGRFSCQNGPVVALNADRWRVGTEGWTVGLEDYRTYLVNHEVGHLLHLHHPDPQCPGEDLPAPVMLQQSTELGECTPNPWPLPWEVDLAAERREPLAPPAEHDVEDHRPSPPPQDQDLQHRAG